MLFAPVLKDPTEGNLGVRFFCRVVQRFVHLRLNPVVAVAKADIIALRDIYSLKARISARAADKAGIDSGNSLAQCCLECFGVRLVGVDHRDGNAALADRLCRDDDYLCLVVNRCCLICGEDNIAVIRENENNVCTEAVKSTDKVLGRRIHRLTSGDHLVCSELVKCGDKPFSCCYRDCCIVLVRCCGYRRALGRCVFACRTVSIRRRCFCHCLRVD